MSHRGSLFALPSGIAAWPVTSIRALTAADLAAALAEVPRLDVLLIGTGAEIAPLPDRFRAPFRELGISLDAMATGPAARTYNVLLAEDRRVGAALMAVD